MPTVREILKENNMELDISEIALSFVFEGDFSFTEKERIPKEERDYEKPIEYVDAYIFHSGKDRLMIVPDDPDYVLNYTSYNSGDIGYFESFGSDGEISIYM